MKKNRIVIIFSVTLGVGVLVTLCLAIYYMYNDSYIQSQKEFAAAQKAFDIGDWQTAWHHSYLLYNYPLSPLSNSPETKRLQDQSSLLFYGDKKRKEGDYAAALAAYDTYLYLFPESAEQLNIKPIANILYLEVVKQTGENNQPEALIEAFSEIITDTPNSQEAAEARALIVKAYDATGKKHIEEKSFILAINTYIAAREFALEDKLISIVDSGYQTAVQGLANDDGMEGQQVIAETLESVCGGKRSVSPAVGFSTDQPPKGLVCNDTFLKLPKEWEAKTPGSLRYIIRVDHSFVVKETCYYTELGTASPGATPFELVVSSKSTTVTVYNAATGGVSETETIYDSSDFQCPNYRTFTGQTENITTGEEMSDQDVLNWLGSFFQ